MNQIFAPVEHGRTADEVVRQIESLILEGVFRVGDRLPGERELARQFDVSRPILREALKALEARGLIASRHGGGTHVADIIGEVFSRPMLELLGTHRKALADFLEYRREIEGVAAEFAARRATAADRALIEAALARVETSHAGGEFDEEAAADVEFHSAIGESAHNIVLLHTLRSCYRLLADGVFFSRSLIYNLPGMRDALRDQHRSIGEAVLAGHPDAARNAARAHMDFVLGALVEAERAEDWQKMSRLRLMQRSSDRKS